MKDKEKSRGDQLREALCYDKKNGYDRVNREELEAVFGRGQDRAGVRGPGRGPGGGRRLPGVQAGHGPEARGQGVPGEPGQVRHAGGDGPEGPGGGREHRGRPHRLPPSGFEAEPPL